MSENNQNTQVARKSIGSFLSFPATQKFLEENLREHKGEFVSNLIALCDGDKNLAECEPKALMMCAMNATALNLPLNKNLGFAYIIPYKGVPSFQIGYKGLIQLAIRTGAYRYLNACEVRQGEISRNKITGQITHNSENPTGAVIGYIAYLELLSGFTASLYMTVDEIEKHAMRFSRSYQYDKAKGSMSSKWSDPAARPKMALKTVLKGLLSTYGVITTDMVKAFETDDNDDRGTGLRDVQEAEVIMQQEATKQDDQSQQTDEPRKIEI
jgi:recombination protein RecT